MTSFHINEHSDVDFIGRLDLKPLHILEIKCGDQKYAWGQCDLTNCDVYHIRDNDYSDVRDFSSPSPVFDCIVIDLVYGAGQDG
ncbi:hypothetical protein Lal_00020124 [Lupinus albus]|nr:hypothetical protein Lal_00020124 [Lupinus albus]